ncbi:hypothetical protein NLI96_g5768 [Meripilus lineatus]|uniref:Phytoene synthase n=1 Tax=Meripilus lineatus TaxID=2056292 RepID=A0AAD5YDL5_9APHY|nr:hypothetical protein NLI96_g5768 [Physisporinus lineatus]
MTTDFGSSPEGVTQNPESYCKDLVRSRDYEWFLISHFYPKELQGAFFALRAFYIELSTVQEAISNSMLGKMRMQFWRDAVKDIGNGRPPRHPIALALYDASQKANLAPYHLKRIIDARPSDSRLAIGSSGIDIINISIPPAIHALTVLFAYTISCGFSPGGVTNHLHVAAGTSLSCLESQEEVFRKGGNAHGIDEAVFEFATLANDHLITAREMFKESGGKIPERARPVFLAANPTALYLERLEKANFDAFEPSLQMRTWRLPWRVWQGYYKGTF